MDSLTQEIFASDEFREACDDVLAMDSMSYECAHEIGDFIKSRFGEQLLDLAVGVAEDLSVGSANRDAVLRLMNSHLTTAALWFQQGVLVGAIADGAAQENRADQSDPNLPNSPGVLLPNARF